jgi:hypothetical protein
MNLISERLDVDGLDIPVVRLEIGFICGEAALRA